MDLEKHQNIFAAMQCLIIYFKDPNFENKGNIYQANLLTSFTLIKNNLAWIPFLYEIAFIELIYCLTYAMDTVNK